MNKNLDSKSNEPEDVQYSTYYEFEDFNPEFGLITRLVITLGPERVPKGFKHDGPFSDDLQTLYESGIGDWVSEVYFINASNEPMTIETKKLGVRKFQKSFSDVVTIESQKWFISEPLIALDSLYEMEADFTLEFNCNNSPLSFKNVAKRMTVDEIKSKYNPDL
ncbi:hypothetical protein I6F65_00450 [Pseudoalteromonas sp. SWXJZ94C]|uniref:hypothetical protein n=1 Tax=unclassified Pseudoalteromonas TaxID=194690 RepID=UPI00140A87EB|nr:MULTISPECIES: hypothetical protein [unclassified Pseudoalteromonas]MBH0055425.1 hypothetical protein [Pseudoalteromonas sp. SWXJZ94C]